jgi:hypothetical protein
MNLLRTVWHERITLFWPIWISCTLLGVLLVLWVARRREGARQAALPSSRTVWSRSATLSVIFLMLFLVCYVAGILVWEDFSYYDDSMFTLGTLVGHDIARPAWQAAGRFFPLGHQEFNLLRHFTRSVIAYHALRIVELLLFCGILLLLDEELSLQARVVLLCLALVTPGILISFGGLIYPEANVLFFLACLVWAVKRFEQSHSKMSAASAVISSQFLLYYKETVFALLLSFAVGRLFLRCWQTERTRFDFGKLREPDSLLDLCLAILSVLFLLYYFAAMYPNYSTGYADVVRLSLKETLATYTRLDLLVWVFVVVTLARVGLILKGNVSPTLLWDGLAIGGIGYFAAYLTLRLQSAYYLAPVDLIAILYCGRFAIRSEATMGRTARLCALALLIVVLLQDLSLSAFRVYEKKNIIHAKAQIGRVIETQFARNPESPLRVYFPFASPHRIMEFAAYMSYLGLPIEGVSGDPNANGRISLVAGSIAKDGPCEKDSIPICHSGKEPQPGDLVVLLPDEDGRANQQQSAAVLLSYRPFPAIPLWLQPYAKQLHVVSPVYPQALPNYWLTASVWVSKCSN